MPCRVSSDVHEWINEGPAVPARDPANPPGGEKSTCPQREEKTPWSFTAACRWGVVGGAERRREAVNGPLRGPWSRPWNTAHSRLRL